VRAGYRIIADDLVDDGRAVMASLNHVVQRDIVTGVRLVVRPARDAQESGCD
jgi:hypothetical protein